MTEEDYLMVRTLTTLRMISLLLSTLPVSATGHNEYRALIDYLDTWSTGLTDRLEIEP